MMITADNDYAELDAWLAGKSRVLLVCDGSLRFMQRFCSHLDGVSAPIIRFSDFQPNPLYESVTRGVDVFRRERCDSIMAVGGGSAMDVAKCIKLYSGNPGDGADGAWLRAVPVPNSVPFLAMPTTAGTGSEATRYAVIYYGGAKQSIADSSIIPGTVLMDPSALLTLPPYQKKATMCDALCHALESFWSVNSTEESMKYSEEAMRGILSNMRGCLANTDEGNSGMLLAAHRAGQAINITQTTAGHAMCYKITSLFGCAHGHAAMLCDRILFPWMVRNTDRCIDPRGAGFLRQTLGRIAAAMGCADAEAASRRFNEIFDELDLDVPSATEEQYAELRSGVNPVRLGNHPVALDPDTIDMLYHLILR